jgi:hypothetical protein
MPRFDAASISSTSSDVPAEISRHESHVPLSGSASGLSRSSAPWPECARGGFAHAAHARKNVRVRHAVRIDRVRQRPRDVLLPDNLAERLRPVLPRDNLVAHGMCCSRDQPLAAMRGTSGTPRHTKTDPLPLLPSGPGGVRGESLHRARSSTHRQSPIIGHHPAVRVFERRHFKPDHVRKDPHNRSPSGRPRL